MTEFRTHTPREHPTSPTATANGSPDPTDQPEAANEQGRKRPTRISSLHIGLIAAATVLVLLVVFLIQNSHTVNINFLGVHLRVSLAVALLTASVAGALITGATGTARIAQLRRSARHSASTNVRQ